MDIINGLAGSRVKSRMLGTKVLIAGKKIYLPNSDVPIVQKLTMAQINAIPRDQFSVSFIEPSMVLKGRSGIKKGRTNLSLHRQQRFHSGGTNGVIGYINPMPLNEVRVEIDGTQTFDIIIKKLQDVIVDTSTAKQSHREALRNQKEAQPHFGIFYTPINEDNLSDCILKIIDSYFGTSDVCKILGTEYKLPLFCVLMHYYFIRIGFLKNKSRQPFYLYLRMKVFDKKERFTAKTFNNYANEYKRVEEAFTNVTQLSINFEKHPTTSGRLQDAFQEIGHTFHKSSYFEELREMRRHVDEWGI